MRQSSPRAPPIEGGETEVRDEVAQDTEAEGDPPPEAQERVLQLHVDTKVSLKRVKMSIEYRDSQDSAEQELDISVSPTLDPNTCNRGMGQYKSLRNALNVLNLKH